MPSSRAVAAMRKPLRRGRSLEHGARQLLASISGVEVGADRRLASASPTVVAAAPSARR